jgi:serine/threonine-protein kinase
VPEVANPRVIDPRPPSTPADSRAPRRRVRALPPDLLRDASRRIGVITLLAAALWVLATILYHVAVVEDDLAWSWQATDAIAIAAAIVSLGFYAYTRKSHDPAFILNVGLAHLIVMALALGLLLHWAPPPEQRHIFPQISWSGAIVLIFAAIVPTSRIRMLIAGAIVVSMNPIGMLVARARGVWDFGPATNALVMHYPDYMLIGVAVLISHVVTSLGREVAKAREMGSYQLGDLIGRGGMGEVYKATHRLLARPAAIKLIRPEMVGAEGSGGGRLALTRFRREATAAANLRSPHTVELYDFGVTDDGTFYFAMELLDGLDLETMVKQYGPMPAARVVHILRQVCESLAEAHASGLVHRDIKPANIHLGRLGLRHDFVKVLDFGLVKSVDASGATQTQATSTGLTPGTPAYMAPEMALGQQVDGRTDIYALGCVAYYLLTGRLAFEGEGLQMLVKRLHEDPVAPSQRTELPVPAELDVAIMACLSRDPAGRPDAAALAASLASIRITPWTESDAVVWWSTHQPRADAAFPASRHASPESSRDLADRHVTVAR